MSSLALSILPLPIGDETEATDYLTADSTAHQVGTISLNSLQ